MRDSQELPLSPVTAALQPTGGAALSPYRLVALPVARALARAAAWEMKSRAAGWPADKVLTLTPVPPRAFLPQARASRDQERRHGSVLSLTPTPLDSVEAEMFGPMRSLWPGAGPRQVRTQGGREALARSWEPWNRAQRR